jgi:hypothetical protein
VSLQHNAALLKRICNIAHAIQGENLAARVRLSNRTPKFRTPASHGTSPVIRLDTGVTEHMAMLANWPEILEVEATPDCAALCAALSGSRIVWL